MHLFFDEDAKDEYDEATSPMRLPNAKKKSRRRGELVLFVRNMYIELARGLLNENVYMAGTSRQHLYAFI